MKDSADVGNTAFAFGFRPGRLGGGGVGGVPTEVKTSVVCWMVAMRVHFHFWKSCTLVGLCRVADGCVRKKVGKRWRLDSAGELEP